MASVALNTSGVKQRRHIGSRTKYSQRKEYNSCIAVTVHSHLKQIVSLFSKSVNTAKGNIKVQWFIAS